MQPQLAEMTYPESDGKPMSDNTLQADWIILLRTNLDALFPDFVAANLLWYPIRNNRKALAPDVLVALGRPKGYRGSYQTWREANLSPQIVFEIRSPSNTNAEMAQKLADYDQFGVEEYYHYDPHHTLLEVFVRQHGHLRLLPVVGSFDSPRLKIRFLLRSTGLQILDPQGQPFRRLEEERAQREIAEHNAEIAQKQAEQERLQREAAEAAVLMERQQRATAEALALQERQQRAVAEALALQERQQRATAEAAAQAERERAERLMARLRALGLED